MQTEIEAKFLNINIEEIRTKLRECGAVLVHMERLMRRKNFDYADARLYKIGGWVRVRDEGEIVTLAYKQLLDRTINGTLEVSLTVEDFDMVTNFLFAIGLVEKSYQETKRERWDLEGVEITIDTWPWIPTFLEIEGDSEEKVRATASLLGQSWDKALHGSVETAYQALYDVTDDEIDSWERIVFSPVPTWLEERRK